MKKKLNNMACNMRPLRQMSHPTDLIKQFTPNWFTMNMGTGILSLMLGAFPYHIAGLHLIAEGLWIVNITLFIIFSVLFIGRFAFYFDSAKKLLGHPVQSMFLGAIPMGLITIVNGKAQSIRDKIPVPIFIVNQFGVNCFTRSVGWDICLSGRILHAILFSFFFIL